MGLIVPDYPELGHWFFPVFRFKLKCQLFLSLPVFILKFKTLFLLIFRPSFFYSSLDSYKTADLGTSQPP